MDLFLSFNGRINRAKWWLGILILWVAQMVVMFILSAVFGVSMSASYSTNDPEAMQAAALTAMIPILIVMLVFLYPALALYTKRWHDRNKSGWWTLILFIPIVGAIWMIVELGILKGTDGDNRFGPDPLA